MRRNFILLCLVLISGFSEPRQAAAEEKVHQETVRELRQRIDARDYTAILEAAELPASIGIPFLWGYAHTQGADPQVQPRAVEAFKNIHDFKEYLQKRMAEKTDRVGDVGEELTILRLIGNLEAAEVVAPYLFDFRWAQPANDVARRLL